MLVGMTKTTAALLCALAAGPLQGAPPHSATIWLTTWAASPSAQNPDPAAMRARKLEFADQTVREIVHTSMGGESVRIKLSNVFGTQAVNVTAAHIALAGAADAVTPGSDRTLTFSGRPAVSILPGALVLSDPVDLKVPALGDLAISLYFSELTMTSTLHYSAQQHSYVAAGNATAAEKLTEPVAVTSWAFLTSVDVSAPPDAATIVALGDSITDGAKSEMDANHRWPNILANRMIGARGPNRYAVVDAGIGGNRILRDANARNIAYGVSALARLERDVLALEGVRFIILLEGINDLGYPESNADEMIAAMKQIVERAHEKGIRVIGGTIMASERAGARANGLSEKEKRRLAVNEWIRTSKMLDGFVDFDKAIKDSLQPGVMAAAYDSGDHLHPNDAGYKAMGEAVDLKLFP
jgi:lysophospholipase L1-like esterase